MSRTSLKRSLSPVQIITGKELVESVLIFECINRYAQNYDLFHTHWHSFALITVGCWLDLSSRTSTILVHFRHPVCSTGSWRTRLERRLYASMFPWGPTEWQILLNFDIFTIVILLYLFPFFLSRSLLCLSYLEWISVFYSSYWIIEVNTINTIESSVLSASQMRSK